MSLLNFWETQRPAKRRRTFEKEDSSTDAETKPRPSPSPSVTAGELPAAEDLGIITNSQTELETSLPAIKTDEDAIEEYETSQNDKQMGLHVRLRDGAWQKGKSSIYVDAWVGYKPWTWVKSSAYVGYTSIWNFLGYAALAVPVTTASRTKDVPDEEWLAHVPRNDSDKFNKQQYDINLVEGMPVGIQVVGGRFGEEKCVAVAKAIEQAMQRKITARASL